MIPMYLPKHFEEADLDAMHALIRSQPLGAWVAPGSSGLLINHLPFLFDADRGPQGTLVSHVARANPVWQCFSREIESVVIFQGPQGYISPSWYPSKQARGKAVPTWNYAVVHAHGWPRVIEDRDWLLDHVTRLSAAHESHGPMPWSVEDAPPDFIEKLLDAIVGIEIPISSLVGKSKLSQNRPAADRQGVVAELLAEGNPAAREMAERMGAGA